MGQAAKPGSLISLDGEMGVGKTVFARGVAEGVGVKVWRGSPTFNLVHEYSGRLPMYHIDAYRMSGNELEDLDLDRMIGAHGVIVMEWADNVADVIGRMSVSFMIRVRIYDNGGSARRIEIER